MFLVLLFYPILLLLGKSFYSLKKSGALYHMSFLFHFGVCYVSINFITSIASSFPFVYFKSGPNWSIFSQGMLKSFICNSAVLSIVSLQLRP